MKDIVYDELVADSLSRRLPSSTKRQVQLPWLPGKVDAIVGMRRSGKTWLMFQRMGELLAAGTAREDLLYINFEDDRLGEVTATDLAKILEAHYRRNPSGRSRTTTLLLDEVQVVDGWERFVRRISDSEDVHVCVTGSSAKLLSREIATSLRGRAVATEVFPFGLMEVLVHNSLPTETSPPARIRSMIEHVAMKYLHQGGFPEIQAVDELIRIRILQDYLDVAILRDLIERHEIANPVALRRFVQQLMNTAAGLFSVHKIHGDLTSQGLSVSKDSLYAWLEHVQDAYVFFAIPIHSHSERARQVNPRKVYAIDPGLVTACARRGTADQGQLLETAVFLELRRATSEIAYLRTADGYEVDFVAASELVQVSTTIADPKTRERELRALRAAMSEQGQRESTLVTLTEDKTVRAAEGVIRIVPWWRWTLERQVEGRRR